MYSALKSIKSCKTISVQMPNMLHNKIYDLCFQFAPFFALTGFIITQCCPAVMWNSNYGLSWVCYILFKHIKQKRHEHWRGPNNRDGSNRSKAFTATHYFPTQQDRPQPFPLSDSMQSWLLSPHLLEWEINGVRACMCAFDLCTVVYVSGGRAIRTTISQ